MSGANSSEAPQPAPEAKEKSNLSFLGGICFFSFCFAPMFGALHFFDVYDPWLGASSGIPELWFGAVFFTHYLLMARSRLWAMAFSRDKSRWEKTRHEARTHLPLALIVLLLCTIPLASRLLAN